MNDDRHSTRRAFLAGLAAGLGAAASLGGPASRAEAFGEGAEFDIALLQYDSPSWNPRPTAIRRALLEIEMTTSILIVDQPSTVEPTMEQLFGYPMIVMAGDRGFDPFSDEARQALGTWLGAGGMLVVDSSEGRSGGDFETAVRRELDAILPGQTLGPIPEDHVVFKSFYLIEGAPGREVVEPFVEGIEYDDRLAVIYNHNDLMGAWARDNFGAYLYEVHPGGERQRQMAYRFGVNLAMYALCLDYKEDQVHVPFILQRRRWRVD